MLDEVVDQFGSAILLDLHAFMAPSDNDIRLGNLKGDRAKPIHSMRSIASASARVS
jgi:hypothetical protein